MEVPVRTVTNRLVVAAPPSARTQTVRQRLGGEGIACLIADYTAGAQLIDLASTYAVARQSVRKLLRAGGVPTRKHGPAGRY